MAKNVVAKTYSWNFRANRNGDGLVTLVGGVGPHEEAHHAILSVEERAVFPHQALTIGLIGY